MKNGTVIAFAIVSRVIIDALMKRFRLYIAILGFAFTFSINATAQSTSVTDRTPEQEATKQTEKLQKELNLTPDQVKHVYDINLKYAHERKQANKRTDAVTRIKKKNEEISRVLSKKQNDELLSKRTRVQSVEIGGERRYTRTDPTNRADNIRRQSQNSYQRRPYNRPVRTSRSAINQNQRKRVDTGNRPVRNSENRVVRPGVPSKSRQSRDIRPAPSNRKSSSNGTFRSPQKRSSESRSTSPNRKSSRPSRNIGSRR